MRLVGPLGNTWREAFGVLGAYGSGAAFTCALLTFCVMQGAFRTATLGRIFAGRAVVLVDAFLIVGVAAVLLLILSACGKGRQRTFGVAVNLITITTIVCIFWLNP